MFVLTRRAHETISFPAFQTTVEVVSVQPNTVRLSVEAPADATIATAAAAAPSTPVQLDRLVQKRLDVARLGLTELRRRLEAGQELDAEIILDKIDEDLHMLQGRLRREVEKAAPRPVAVRKDEVRGGPRRPR